MEDPTTRTTSALDHGRSNSRVASSRVESLRSASTIAGTTASRLPSSAIEPRSSQDPATIERPSNDARHLSLQRTSCVRQILQLLSASLRTYFAPVHRFRLRSPISLPSLPLPYHLLSFRPGQLMTEIFRDIAGVSLRSPLIATGIES